MRPVKRGEFNWDSALPSIDWTVWTYTHRLRRDKTVHVAVRQNAVTLPAGSAYRGGHSSPANVFYPAASTAPNLWVLQYGQSAVTTRRTSQPSRPETPAELRARAERIRDYARQNMHNDVGPALTQLAAELDERAAEIEQGQVISLVQFARER